jgi:tRNA nucleotidyltransferase/poly(A) polymerase
LFILAAITVDGFKLDIVNLRKELYSQNSRIPTIQIGTPLEDAFRRDLTINSLFYNIHTREIEDFTELGVSDLYWKMIRTPLPPYDTFLDDPLRILRILRFACRFNFNLHPDILKCFEEHSDHLLTCFQTKISPERRTVEIDGMLKTDQSFVRAIYFLHKWKLLPTIFNIPTAGSAGIFNKTNPQHPVMQDFSEITEEGKENRLRFYSAGVWKSLFAYRLLPLLELQHVYQGGLSFAKGYRFDKLKSFLPQILSNPENQYFL